MPGEERKNGRPALLALLALLLFGVYRLTRPAEAVPTQPQPTQPPPEEQPPPTQPPPPYVPTYEFTLDSEVVTA